MPHAPQTGIVDPLPVSPDHIEQSRRRWQAYRDELSAEIGLRWGGQPEELETICAHALLPVGKLLRPLLCLESAVAVGGVVAPVIPAAVAVECGHVASLVHDDIIDGDDTRRGRPSAQHRFGIDRAILAGDRLIFSMFQTLGECQHRGIPAERIVAAMRVFADMGTDLCRGETVELALRGDAASTVDSYLMTIGLKTAALTRGACAVGAILGGGTPEEIHALGAYGDALGIAFQIEDDLLPYAQDSPATDKPATSDLRNRRPTLPILLAYHAAHARDRTIIEQMLAGRLTPDTAYHQIREIVHRTGAVTAARRTAEDHTNRARVALATLPATPSRTQLETIADELIRRQR